MTAIIMCASLAASAALTSWHDTTALSSTIYDIGSSVIPAGFEGFRIVQVSDLHQGRFGPGQSRLAAAIRRAAPDIIVFTGDLIDGDDTSPATQLIAALQGLAPMYYVTGNHEARTAAYDTFRIWAGGHGVTVMDGCVRAITRGDDEIALLGIADPEVLGAQDDAAAIGRQLTELMPQAAGRCRVLLAHRPEQMAVYAAYGIDLALTGHAHGGQIRLPGIGALFAPDQGLLPRYDHGIYTMAGTTMVLSRGLGCSVVPIRLFNPAELVTVVLHHGPSAD